MSVIEFFFIHFLFSQVSLSLSFTFFFPFLPPRALELNPALSLAPSLLLSPLLSGAGQRASKPPPRDPRRLKKNGKGLQARRPSPTSDAPIDANTAFSGPAHALAVPGRHLGAPEEGLCRYRLKRFRNRGGKKRKRERALEKGPLNNRSCSLLSLLRSQLLPLINPFTKKKHSKQARSTSPRPWPPTPRS